MRLGDVVLMSIMVGMIFVVFISMVNDTEMQDFYTNNVPELNLSQRESTMRGYNTSAYLIEEAIMGQTEYSGSNVTSIQEDLEQASKSEIGLLSVPGAVLKAMKVVFSVFRFKWFNTLISGVEQMFGLEAGALSLLTLIGKFILWIIIFLFVGAILRWIV